jgi:DNA-directed RNA polymerase subunit alpha
MFQLPEAVKIISRSENRAVFEISPLVPGYGATIANPLRRVLFSSLEGAAVTTIKIKGVDHEFSALAGVHEDVIQIILNLKKIRFRSFIQEPIVATLRVKGERKVTAKDLKLTAELEVVNPDQHIASITDKKTELELELTVERGIGYVPVEQRQKEKLPIGVIAVDAIFSPVRLVNFTIDDIRVGQRIDYNKIVMDIETDGSLTPEAALKNASEILIEHFKVISQVHLSAPKEKTQKKKSKKDEKGK